MHSALKKYSIRLGCVVVLLFVLLSIYKIGLLHRVARKPATAAAIEWNISAPQTIWFYYPRWACGEEMPPYLLVETDDRASEQAVGTHIRIDYTHLIDFNEYYFGECRGHFKNSLAMLIGEDELRLFDGGGA